MLRYIAVIITLFIYPVKADDWGACGYIPKKTDQYQHPEMEVFNKCATYKSGILQISEEHIKNLDFDKFGLASFFSSGQYFYVKPDGRFLPVIFYDNGTDYFEEGLTRSLRKGKVAYYNKDLELVLAPGYDWAWPFHNGKALVCEGCVLTPDKYGHQVLKGGLWGYINKQGEEVVPVKYKASDIPNK
ncbi:WG repeat-containing protein [Alteromonas sp. C1M14]|uniref:WG repeat-containing protein n=1 Tax=Alteromonas sp. C1M14 TaxID=2841567 RepID=UPI001C0A564D|nr:WG repeat-containing protein [Alteromonas sp. C1M14]MBU2978749.1 WG repeat-containing protein [Alteromonas sp. C1M14]